MIMNFPTCKSHKSNGNPNDLQLLVDEYLHTWGNCYDIEAQWWGDRTLSWDEAVARAWKSLRNNGKMHPHQCNVGAKKLAKGLEVSLTDAKQPKDFTDFHGVYDWVKSVVEPIKGLGATTAYDVALRLGMWLKLEPILVYLHAGAADGAKKFGVTGESVSLSVFPQAIQSLGATHAENFLCIYKDRIVGTLNQV